VKKVTSSSIPVYDLLTVDPRRESYDIIAGPLADYDHFSDKLLVPHRNNFYEILLVTDGKGTKTIDFEHFDIHPNRIYFIAPGQVHNWQLTSKSDGYFIHFSEKIFYSSMCCNFYLEQFPFLRAIPKNSVMDIYEETVKEIISSIKRIIIEVKKKDVYSMDIICFNMISLFVSIIRDKALSVNNHLSEQNQTNSFNFKMLVNKYFTEKRLPKDYAAMLYVTPSQLNAKCKDIFGKSAGNIIRDRILLEAKRLLINTDVSISEIAYRLNFSDNSYFTKFFKKYTGLTPEEFRK